MTKPYPSVMKEKRRYVVFEIVSENKFAKDEVMRALWDTVLGTIGALGAAKAAFWIFEFDARKQKGILRCTNKELPVIRGSLVLLDKINSKKAFVHVTDVTGTIKKAKKLMEK